MLRFRKWVLTLGILVTTPGLTMAGPLSLFKSNKQKSSAQQSNLSNQQIAEGVALALRAAQMRGFDIEVEVKNGTAILFGRIADAKQKKQATQIVGAVDGVRRVDNRLQIINSAPTAKKKSKGLLSGFFGRKSARRSTPAPAPVAAQSAGTSNQEMAVRIANALRQANLSAYDIEVRYIDGVATLTGEVDAADKKALAERVVRSVPGVKSMNNQLSLMKRSVQTQQPSTATNSFDTFVASKSQSTPTQQARFIPDQSPLSQQAPVAQTGGIQKNTPSPSSTAAKNNQQTAESIAKALGQAQLAGYDMEIRYRHGTATVTGAVATPWQIAHVGQIVMSVPGVQAVDNQLQLLAAQWGPAGGMPQGGFPIPSSMHSNGNMMQSHMMQVAYQNQPPPAGGGFVPPNAAGFAPQNTIPRPPSYGHPGSGASQVVYNMPHLPNHAWPTYANYPNYAQVSYPKQYSASAWPYIGPFYPYPQIPLGWRQVQLEWDDGHWNLNFRPRTDRWWWFLDPKNW